jgi:hypothetical protein
MSEQQSPWSRSGSVEIEPAPVAYAKPPASAPKQPVGPLIDLDPGWTRSGSVTGLGERSPAPDVIEIGGSGQRTSSERRMIAWFASSAGVILVIGLVLLFGMAMTGSGPLVDSRHPSGPSDVIPPLAKACPPPSADARNLPPAPPPPPGARSVDPSAGISYAAQGAPWVPWYDTWNAGDLHVRYAVGQHFVTETYDDGTGAARQYHASILSGSVPTAENDALTLDLKCTGHQVLADVRQSYYPQPNTIEMFRDEVTVLGGRPAWVSKFRLHFHQSGLKATSELVGLALIDVGRPNAAILYISIPDTHTQFDHLVDDELSSMRPT